MIQQKRHYKCQSLWPWNTQDTIPWTEVMSLVVSDWQMYKQPYLWYCCSWTWGTCHLCHFTTIAISPNLLITLSPPSGSQCLSVYLPTSFNPQIYCRSQCSHCSDQYTYLNWSSFLWVSAGLFSNPYIIFFSIHMVHEIHTNQRREWKQGIQMGKKMGQGLSDSWGKD